MNKFALIIKLLSLSLIMNCIANESIFSQNEHNYQKREGKEEKKQVMSLY